MEEKIGKRVNLDRVDEALGTGAETDRHRLPVLPGHALRRPHPAPERGAGHRRRDPRRLPAPARRGHARRHAWPGRSPRPDRAQVATRLGRTVRRRRARPRPPVPADAGQRLRGGVRGQRVDRPLAPPTHAYPPPRSAPDGPGVDVPRAADAGCARARWLGVPVDAVEEWSRAQQRVIDLVADLPPERAELRVPACPDWTVRDLLSHMVGLGVDVVAGDEPDDHNETWTAPAGAGPAAAATSRRWSRSGRRSPSRCATGCGRTPSARSAT